MMDLHANLRAFPWLRDVLQSTICIKFPLVSFRRTLDQTSNEPVFKLVETLKAFRGFPLAHTNYLVWMELRLSWRLQVFWVGEATCFILFQLPKYRLIILLPCFGQLGLARYRNESWLAIETGRGLASSYVLKKVEDQSPVCEARSRYISESSACNEGTM